MSRITQRAVAIAIGLLASGALAEAGALVLGRPGVVASVMAWRKGVEQAAAQRRLEAAAERREAAAQAELAELTDHPWAGTYRTAGRYPLLLTLAPSAGFAIDQHSGCGNCAGWRAAGAVAAASGSRVTLELERSCCDSREDTYHWWCRDGALHFVHWGELLFAVPESNLATFYIHSNDGYSFPDELYRAAADGGLEAPARPEGLPDPVPGYEHLLLDGPLRGRVLALSEWRVSGYLGCFADAPDHDVTYTIDLGAADGLALGHRLFFDAATPWRPDRSGEVVQVDERSARVLVTWAGSDRAEAERVLGAPVSTLHPQAPR